MKGLVIGGQFGDILIRQKAGQTFELGELLIAEQDGVKVLLDVFDLVYGSQLTPQQLELVSGLELEEDTTLEMFEPHLRHYVLARAKNVLVLKDKQALVAKHLPVVFSTIREITVDDLQFLDSPTSPLMLGTLRSGSKELGVPVVLDGEKVLSHHVLVTGTTGRGKSVCMANLFWNCLNKDYCGMLILDPHDEYYANVSGKGLKDHPAANEKLVYYTKNPPPGGRSLKIPLDQLLPQHFFGSADWSDAQREALFGAYGRWNGAWVEQLLKGESLSGFHEGTLGVLKRRLMQLLNARVDDAGIQCAGVFDTTQGSTTIHDVLADLSKGKTVIVDTSDLPGATEILVASMLAQAILDKNKNAEPHDLRQQPVVSIVLEEAPRVLGKDVLERGPNVFSTIAREGRKFKVGLVAITQLPSLIPREVLANMNTKIILGTELKPERQAIIESAAQDLSQDDRTIASLDKGEAIITSTFTKFATPVRIPFFQQTVDKSLKEAREKARPLFTQGGLLR